MDRAVIGGLLSQLEEDVVRRDGETAVRTHNRFRLVAGPEFTDRLVTEQLMISLGRAAGIGIVTD